MWARSAVLVAATVAVTASCGSGDPLFDAGDFRSIETVPTGTESGTLADTIPISDTLPPHTVPVREIDRNWMPAYDPPEDLAGELAAKGLTVLMPTPAPIDDPDSTRGRLATTGFLQPGGTTSDFLGVSVAVDVGSISLAILSSPPNTQRCAWDAESVAVRGREGCAGRAPFGWVVWWDEEGRVFQVAFDTSLSLADGIAWLEEWTPLP
jgi:hypothetical protein